MKTLEWIALASISLMTTGQTDLPQFVSSASSPRLVGLNILPARTAPGTTVRGAVILDRNAPQGGVTVYVASSRRDVRVPSQVVVRQGQKSAFFLIHTDRKSPLGLVKVSALRGKDVFSANLLISQGAGTGGGPVGGAGG